MTDPTERTATTGESRSDIPLGVAILAVLLFVVAAVVAQEKYDWLWPLAGLLGGTAAVMGWKTGKPRPRGKSLTAVVLGGLVFSSIVLWIIVAIATGEF